MALVAARDRLIAALALVTLLLTQTELPALHRRLLDMEPPS